MNRSSGVKPVDKAIWSDSRQEADSMQTGGDGSRGEAKEQPARQSPTDTMSFSESVQQRWQGEGEETADPYDEKLHDLLARIEENNIRLRDGLSKTGRKRRAVPSVLGLGLNTAATTLKRGGFKVRGVVQEFHEREESGRVVAQSPFPGSNAVMGEGVRLIVSKGPAPEDERQSRGFFRGGRSTRPPKEHSPAPAQSGIYSSFGNRPASEKKE